MRTHGAAEGGLDLSRAWWGLACAAVVLAPVVMASGPAVDGHLPRLLVLLVAAPILEEAVFRAGIQEALLRLPTAPWCANVTTAVLFGLAHAWLRADVSALAVVAPALLVGWVYTRTRRLLPCVLLHSALNAAWVTWRLMGPATPGIQ